jgi:hypothetical protein
MIAPIRILSALFITLAAGPLTAGTPDARSQLVDKLSEQFAAQVQSTAHCEVLRQSYEQPDTGRHDYHIFQVRLKEGIQVVTESHHVDGALTQQDYYLHDSKVYAYRVSRQEQMLDGKTKRVSDNYFFFDHGTPIYHSAAVARVPVSLEEVDLTKTKAKEHEVPLPTGMEGWGDRLTGRAFDIARTFKPGAGRYIFSDWDKWLLKDAPPEGSGDPPKRDANWLPPAGTLVLPVTGSTSPSGVYAIGWGYEKGPVDWKDLASPWGETSVTFSTKIPEGPLSEELQNDKNFLINAISGKPIRVIGEFHEGERQRFNHDELQLHWSPTDACFVAIETAKWNTDVAVMGWIKDGRCEQVSDILGPLNKAANDAVRKSKHPAAKRMRDEGIEGFSTTMSQILVEDDGSFEAVLYGQIPKDDLPSGYFEVVLIGTLSPGKGEESAVLKLKSSRVLPPESNN